MIRSPKTRLVWNRKRLRILGLIAAALTMAAAWILAFLSFFDRAFVAPLLVIGVSYVVAFVVSLIMSLTATIRQRLHTSGQTPSKRIGNNVDSVTENGTES